MMISLCNEVIRELDFAAQCALARGLGYDGLELAPFTLADEPHRLAQNRAQTARDDRSRPWCRDHGAALAAADPAWPLDHKPGRSAVRERTIDVMRRLIELCADLGGRVLVHGSPKQRPIPEGETRERAKARAMECFAAIANDAEQAECHLLHRAFGPRSETEIINTVAEAAAIVREIDSPAVRTMIDCCAAGQSEDEPVHALIDDWLPPGLVAHIHLNDPNLRGPGQGDMAFKPIIQALKQHNYRGIMSVEPFVYEPDGPTAAARAIGYISGLRE